LHGAPIPADIFIDEINEFDFDFGFSTVPPTGIADIKGAMTAMFVFIIISVGIWVCILRRRLRGNN
jgi:hypothetical protein